MCGDYEFETRSMGLSGASGKDVLTLHLQFFTTLMYAGRHCCLWCHIESSALQSPPHIHGAVTPRTDATLASDLQDFQRNGSNIKNAKNFNNVIRKPFFPIPLTQVRLCAAITNNHEFLLLHIRSALQVCTLVLASFFVSSHYLKMHATSWM